MHEMESVCASSTAVDPLQPSCGAAMMDQVLRRYSCFDFDSKILCRFIVWTSIIHLALWFAQVVPKSKDLAYTESATTIIRGRSHGRSSISHSSYSSNGKTPCNYACFTDPAGTCIWDEVHMRRLTTYTICRSWALGHVALQSSSSNRRYLTSSWKMIEVHCVTQSSLRPFSKSRSYPTRLLFLA